MTNNSYVIVVSLYKVVGGDKLDEKKVDLWCDVYCLTVAYFGVGRGTGRPPPTWQNLVSVFSNIARIVAARCQI